MNTDQREHTLVIVDDEAMIRQGLAQYVDWQGLGFRVKATFEDGLEAIQFLSTNAVDVVLTDIKMAEVSGIDLALEIARHQPRTKVLFMSGHKVFDYAHQAIKCNVADYLIKPIDINYLQDVFHRLREELAEQHSINRVRDILPFEDTAFMDALLDEQPENEEALQDIINRFRKQAESEEDGVPDYRTKILERASAFIEKNFSHDLTLDEVANHVHLSPVYFSRFFHERSGEKFIDFLTRTRITHASMLLRQGHRPIAEISRMVGYQSSRHFSKVFKRIKGATPTEYLHMVAITSETDT